MDNQTRNHLNLQKHIADQDHIIRVRNVEITALRKRAEKAEKERAEHAGPSPLTPYAITDEAMRRAVKAWEETGELRPAIFAAITAPVRPKGAEEIEALIDKAGEDGEGADNESLANYLATRLFDPTIKEA